jgi:NitT/TauT family transport system substrate-binding protein
MPSRLLSAIALMLTTLASMLTPGAAAGQAAAVPVRVGLLQYGTVSWEVEVIRRNQLDVRAGITLQPTTFALKDAANVALQAGAVDVIVSDWIWVARQRAEGRDFTFVPFSRAIGSLVVRPDAGIRTVADLRGKRLGVAGGGLDKSWLLLRAYTRSALGTDAAQLVRADFAAPPLLNALMLRGELPAVLNYWPFAARLRAAGMQELLGFDEVFRALGVPGDVPMIGWVFRTTWAERNRAAIDGLLDASASAKELLRGSEAAWQDVRPLAKADNEAIFAELRAGYIAGIPIDDSRQAEEAARRIFRILADEGGAALVGKASDLPAGTFWHGKSNP